MLRRNLHASLAVAGILSSIGLALWNRHLAAELRRRAAPSTPAAILLDTPLPLHLPEKPVAIPRPAAPTGVQPPTPLPQNATLPPLTESMRRSLMQMALQNDARIRLQLLHSMGVRLTFDDVLALTEGHQLQFALFSLLNSSDDFRSADLMAWAEKLPAGKDRQRAIQAVAYALSREDPAVLLEWLWSLPATDADVARNQAMTMALQRMASTNPEEAEKWLAKLGPDWPNLSVIAMQLANRRIAQDINAAATWASALPSGPLRDEAFKQLANRLAIQSPEAALEWCMAIESETVRNATLTQMMPQWIRQQPDEAAAWIEQLPQGGMRDAAVRGLVNGLAYTHPETAAAWVEMIDNRGVKREALSIVVSSWARTDPGRAGEWVNGMETGLVKDTAQQSMAFSLAQTNPAAALRWAESIQNSTMRNQALQVLKARSTTGSRQANAGENPVYIH